MNSTLKQFYQEEWQSNPTQSLDELAAKYGFDIEDLGDISDWQKYEPEEKVPAPTQPQPQPQQVQVITTPPPPTSIGSEDEQLTNNITDFKKRMVRECLHRLKVEGNRMDTKELSELAKVVDIVDKSLKTNVEGNNVNVLIQNIVNKYGDDC